MRGSRLCGRSLLRVVLLSIEAHDDCARLVAVAKLVELVPGELLEPNLLLGANLARYQ